MPDPIKNSQWSFVVSLISVGGAPSIHTAPTLAAGDFQVSTDLAAFANLGTLPVVSPANSGQVRFVLTAAEMNGDVIGIKCTDQTAPKDWHDCFVQINTTTSSSGVTAGEVAREVWANSGRTLDGVSSNATIKGIENYANISSVTLNIGTHSGATIQGVLRINSGVTLNADVHSGASVEIKAGGIQAASVGAATLTSAKFASGAIDAVALATDAGQEIADRLIARNIEGGSDTGRVVGDAFAVLRNKVAIDGSTVTVYGADDSTSRWTGTVTTGSDPISGVDPNGP
jgi:hypothetical protein